MSSTHKRRPEYWKYYEHAAATMDEFMENILIELLNKYPHPTRKTSNFGAPTVHSEAKLDFACLMMTADNDPYRSTYKDLRSVKHIWNEPIPTHKKIVEHMQTIDMDWLDFILAYTAFLCLEEIAKSNATAPLGADSSGIETTRYEYVETPDSTLYDFMPLEEEPSRFKKYLKYHITAILGHQIILTAITTPSNVHDSKMLPVMLEKIKKFGFDFSGQYFNADRGYDSEENFRELFASGMIPNIKQRKYKSQKNSQSNSAKTYRAIAAKMFDPKVYKKRSLIEGIFGAEETRRHQLQCRFLIESNKNRFAKFRAISWNLEVLHRFRWANELGIEIPSYNISKDKKCPDTRGALDTFMSTN